MLRNWWRNKKSSEEIINDFRVKVIGYRVSPDDIKAFIAFFTENDALALEPLVYCLDSHESQDLQFVAYDALARIGKRAIPSLIANLNNKDLYQQIITLLGRIDEVEVTNVLISQLATLPAISVIAAANTFVKATDTFIDILAPYLRHTNRTTRIAAGEALVRKGSASVPALIGVLKSENISDIRASTKYFLTMIGTPAIPYLLELLTSGEIQTQIDAIEILGYLGHPSSVPVLIAKLQGSEQERIAAMLALGRIGDHRGIKPLNALLHDESELICETAKQALRWLEDKHRVNPLVRALWQLDSWTGRTAQLLGYYGDERAIEPLLLVLRFSYVGWDTRDVANALVKLDAQNPTLVDTLIELLPTFDDSIYSKYVIEAIAASLGKIGDPRAIEPLFAIFQQRQTPALINSLARFQDKRIIGDLIKLALTPPVRYPRWGLYNQQAAALALAQFPDEHCIHVLITLLNDAHQQVQFAAMTALTKIGMPAVDALILTLNDSDKARRANAAKVLGRIGDKRSLDALRLATQDKNKRVRAEAEFALKRIASGLV